MKATELHSKNRQELLGGEDSENSRKNRSEALSSQSRNRELIQAHTELSNELQRMRLTASVIEDSSKTIHSIDSRYSEYGKKLQSAGRSLKELKRRMESDDRYIYLSFLFFLFTAAWIFIKRVGIVRGIQWLVARGVYGASYLAEISGTAPTEPVEKHGTVLEEL